MKKPKNTELNFLYMDERYQNKENKKKKNIKKETKSKTKKNSRAGAVKSAQETRFDFDNEIVIGVTKVPDRNHKYNSQKAKKTTNSRKLKQDKNKNKNKTQKNKKVSQKEIKEVKRRRKVQKNKKQVQIKNNTKEVKQNNKKSKFIKEIIKWTILLSALVAAFIFFMMSPLFNLATIEVINNEKINGDTIISLSEIKIGENIYKTSAKQIEENIKQNAYIESAKIGRKLPNKIVITVNERKATYMLEYANSYAYINNQGYILEISQGKLELPIIVGYTTNTEDIKTGNRLNEEDLEKLAIVLKIVESANANEIGNLITGINIQNKQNYSIILEGEKKTAYFGDASNLSNRMLYLKAVLEEEKGVEGEIFINGDLNKTDVYFRRKE